MAGKEKKTRIVNQVEADKNWRSYCDKDTDNEKNWNKQWGWILDEYKALQEQMADVSKKSEFLKDVNRTEKPEDNRSIKKIPESTNHEYGWIPSKEEFKLEKYGPDVVKPLPLPENYAIFKEQF